MMRTQTAQANFLKIGDFLFQCLVGANNVTKLSAKYPSCRHLSATKTISRSSERKVETIRVTVGKL